MSGATGSGAVEHVDVAIVGAGFAGIGTAIRLAREGGRSFALLERGERVGGTWRDNTYPGAACDIPSHLYSFSFLPHARWSRTFATGDEIQAYLEDAVENEGLTPHTRLRTDVTDASWDETAGCWRLALATTDGVESLTADALVLACGRLSEPALPDVPGIDTFSGAHFHSARWDHSVPLEGARVAIVGTGASAVQLLPHVAERAGAVTLFQRSAAWVLPRDERPYTAAEQALFAKDPGEIARLRSDLFWRGEELFAARSGDASARAALQRRALAHLESQVADSQLRDILTPDYEIGCKRILISNTYYPALAAENCDVVTDRIEQITPTGIVAGGQERPIDVLIVATGFHTTELPITEHLTGRSGQTLAQRWEERGMSAYKGTAVADFPNLFFIVGPNTGLGHSSMVFMIESQVTYIVDAVRTMRRGAHGVLEVTEAAERSWSADIQERMKRTVWSTGGCASWYLDKHGNNTTLWPRTTFSFRGQLARFDVDAYDVRPITGTSTTHPTREEVTA